MVAEKLADGFEITHMTDRWEGFNVEAVGIGMIPSQNPQESFHHATKRPDVMGLRKGTSGVVDMQLPSDAAHVRPAILQ